jgi:hypothetical protein
MTTQTSKRLPYGNSNFESVRTENYVYVDKTRFIELLENEGNKNHFFIRPRKFGKSLFFSMLSHYYDINGADKFDTLFDDLYSSACVTWFKRRRTAISSAACRTVTWRISTRNTLIRRKLKKPVR